MKIGFDWGGVLDTYGQQFAQVATALRSGGHKVYIISAVHMGEGLSMKAQIESMWMNLFDEVITLECPTRESQPEAKLKTIKEIGIDWFFDDRSDTCDLLQRNGVLAFTVPKPVGISS